MAKFIINHEDAKKMTSSYFNGDYEVVQTKVCGFMDGNLIWLLAGGDAFGSWDGLVSTDGNKLVFMKTGYFEGKIKKTWELSKSDISNIQTGAFRIKILCKEKQKGLTTAGILELLVRLMLVFGIFTYRSKRVDIKPKNEFKNLENFKKLLSKFS